MGAESIKSFSGELCNSTLHLVSLHHLNFLSRCREFSGELAAGEHRFAWNCGGALPCAPTDGMYECLVWMNGRVETLPMVLAR